MTSYLSVDTFQTGHMETTPIHPLLLPLTHPTSYYPLPPLSPGSISIFAETVTGNVKNTWLHFLSAIHYWSHTNNFERFLRAHDENKGTLVYKLSQPKYSLNPIESADTVGITKLNQSCGFSFGP